MTTMTTTTTAIIRSTLRTWKHTYTVHSVQIKKNQHTQRVQSIAQNALQVIDRKLCAPGGSSPTSFMILHIQVFTLAAAAALSGTLFPSFSLSLSLSHFSHIAVGFNCVRQHTFVIDCKLNISRTVRYYNCECALQRMFMYYYFFG